MDTVRDSIARSSVGASRIEDAAMAGRWERSGDLESGLAERVGFVRLRLPPSRCAQRRTSRRNGGSHAPAEPTRGSPLAIASGRRRMGLPSRNSRRARLSEGWLRRLVPSSAVLSSSALTGRFAHRLGRTSFVVILALTRPAIRSRERSDRLAKDGGLNGIRTHLVALSSCALC
jgi:hypothetical protein